MRNCPIHRRQPQPCRACEAMAEERLSREEWEAGMEADWRETQDRHEVFLDEIGGSR